MLRGVGAAVAFLLAMQALPAQAQSGDLPVCRSSYSKAWERVSGGNDLVAMDRAIAAIPVNNCPNLHAEASSIRAKAAARIEAARVAEVRRVESERRAAEEAQRAADAAAAKSAQAARDKDAAQARELKRVRDEEAAKAAKAARDREAIQARELKRVRDEEAAKAAQAARDREAAQARELKRVRDEEAAKAAQAARDREAAQAKELERIKKEADGKAWLVAKEADTIASYAGYLTAYPNGEYAGLAKQARERLGNVRLSVCNNSTDEKVFVSLVYQPVGASSMQGKGWYDVERGKCRELFTTATRTFYVRRSAVDGRIWEGAGTQTYSFCAGNSAFDYTWSGNCPTDVPAAAYYRYTIPAGVASYNANLVDSPQRAADVAAWDLARRTDSILAYDSYLGTHPNGLYASNARSARKALLPLRVSVCNKSGSVH